MLLKKIKDFFLESIWNIRLSSLPFSRAWWLKVCRIIVLTVRFFLQNRLTLHAASLTYYTLLAIVPVLALMFGLAKGYGFDDVLRQKLMQAMQGNENAAERILQFTDSAIANASGGIVAGVGVLLLIWTAVKLLASIEATFNRIWGVTRGRSWSRKFCDYLTLLVICPFLLVVMATTSDTVMNHLKDWGAGLGMSDFWFSFVDVFMGCLHLVSAWFIFYFIYAFVPNTKVTFKAAFISGILAGSAYAVLQSLYVYLQVRLTSYNAVYGSFAALPFFMILMNAGWVLTILGAQLSFAIQNVNLYELEPGSGMRPLCSRRYKICALRIVHKVARNFVEHGKPLSAVQLSQQLEIPIRTTRAIIYALCEVNILAQLMSDSSEDDMYQLAIPADEVTSIYVLKQLDRHGADFAVPMNDMEFEEIYNSAWSGADSQPLYLLDLNKKA
ncbi:MAG: YihY/virulence factor BrkB family protein [Lentisphaeria bacterium]|nr:YihY/virulence factor BrkB family protein [Lentisphaeria bacterium]